MYVTDRINNGVDAIDTTTNTVIGRIPVPPCQDYNANGGAGLQCPSGVQVAPDLRKLIVTDRVANPTAANPTATSRIWIYDISGTATPQAPIASPAIGQGGNSGDELDYDPVNRRAYVANTAGNFFVTVVDMVANTILGQIPMPANLEQPRFNPVDGMIYQVVSGNNTLVKIDPTVDGFGAIIQSVNPSGCGASDTLRGLDIDPLTNTGLLGCTRNSATSGNPQLLLDMTTLNVIAQFPQIQATDTLAFNNNTRRWYEGGSSNTNAGTPGQPGCPSDNTRTAFPVVGVFDVGTVGNPTNVAVSAACSGRGAHSLGVDTIGNNVYVPAPQFPADPSSTTTGQSGVVVFHDPTPGQTQGAANVTLGNNGSVSFTPAGTGATVQGTLTGLAAGATVRLVVATTVGNEVVSCTVTGTTATCNGTLIGAPIAGAPVLLSSNGAILASGKVVSGPLPPGTLTPQQAIAQAQGLAGFTSGQAGTTCTHLGGAPCTGNANGLQVSGIQTSSMTWTVTATLPPAPPAGAGTPLFVITTTAGIEAVPCTPALAAAPAPGTVVRCTATTVGNALQGASAVLVFPGVGAAAGPAVGPAVVTGPGPAAAVVPPAAAAVPLLPPPPPIFLPPPPSPLIPAPPSALGTGMMQMPEVPVIPEADTLPLLLGGLAALGALAGWRARRRPQ
jgi:hypothetical protein